MSVSDEAEGTDVVLVEQELNSIKLAVLDLIRTEIVSNVEPRRHFTYLRSRNVLDERDCDEIKAIPSRAASAEKFLDILMKKGSKGYDEFCKALMYDQTQTFLLTKLSMKLDVLRAKVLEHKRQLKVLQATANADEKLGLREQQRSQAIKQLQNQSKQQPYHPHLHKHPPTSPSVPNGRTNFLHVPQHQVQQPLAYHHSNSYPANFATTAPSPVPGSTSPVRSHSPILSPVATSYTHHHLMGPFTLPPNLSFHANRQHQVPAVGQDSSRPDFYRTSSGGRSMAQTYNVSTGTSMVTQPRGWSTDPTMLPGPQSIVGLNSQPQPCGQLPLLACRGQDET